jgi:GTPase Era involved in 16S rRNA processing
MARSRDIWGGAGLADAIAAAAETADAFVECGRSEEASLLREAIDGARSMRFAIGVVGRTKRGKSTLINGILGRGDDLLAPVGKAPATNVVTCFASDEKEEARVIYGQAGEPRRPEAIPIAAIRSYACEELNPGNRKNVERLEVVGPFPKLPTNVVLVDTPGAHNALTEAHGNSLLAYLPRLDAVIFLISADAPLVEAELDLLADIRRSDISKILFAMNKADRIDAEELAEATNHNRQVLLGRGYGEAELIAISARKYMQTGFDPGVESLLASINTLVSEEKGRIVGSKLAAMTARLREAVQASCAEELSAAEKTDADLEGEIASISELKANLASGRSSRERRFRRQWSEGIAAFEDCLTAVRSGVLAECREFIDRAGSMHFADLGHTLHTTIVMKLDDALQPHMERLRRELEEAAATLEVEFAMQLKSLAGSLDRVSTSTSSTERTVATIGAGVPAAIGAVVCTQIPGLVASAVLSSAPTVATMVWWNPVTWATVAATGAAAGGVSLAGGAAGVLLAPVAALGAPLLLGLAGYKMATTWIARNAQTRDELSMATRDRIEELVNEVKAHLSRLKRKDDDILAQFEDLLESRLEAYRIKLNDCVSRRPTPERVGQLRKAIALIGRDSLTDVGRSKTLPKPLF